VIRGIAAAAGRADQETAARDALAAGGSAVDAVIAGWLAAAGSDVEPLLAPVVVLVAGAGAGARVFDGRAAQPGKGQTRPRGFQQHESIPLAARFAVPRSLAMLQLLHATRGRLSLRELGKAGIATAKSLGATGRAKLIQRACEAGNLALRAPDVLEGLIASAGRVAGGVLGEQDIEEARPSDGDASRVALGEGELVRPPWDGVDGDSSCVVACDARGMFAAIAWARGPAARLATLEIALPATAIPVLRGVTRTAPGTPLEAPAPIAIVTRKGFSAAIAAPTGASIPSDALAGLLEFAAAEQSLAQLGRGTIAVVSNGRDARAVGIA
jgi:gamma-glutamyltranspeptidase/glutathione hydrolase